MNIFQTPDDESFLVEFSGGILHVAFNRPIVVAMQGAAAGAGQLYPLAADVVVGESNAAFVFAHQCIGLNPDGAGVAGHGRES